METKGTSFKLRSFQIFLFTFKTNCRSNFGRALYCQQNRGILQQRRRYSPWFVHGNHQAQLNAARTRIGQRRHSEVSPGGPQGACLSRPTRRSMAPKTATRFKKSWKRIWRVPLNPTRSPFNSSTRTKMSFTPMMNVLFESRIAKSPPGSDHRNLRKNQRFRHDEKIHFGEKWNRLQLFHRHGHQFPCHYVYPAWPRSRFLRLEPLTFGSGPNQDEKYHSK